MTTGEGKLGMEAAYWLVLEGSPGKGAKWMTSIMIGLVSRRGGTKIVPIKRATVPFCKTGLLGELGT